MSEGRKIKSNLAFDNRSKQQAFAWLRLLRLNSGVRCCGELTEAFVRECRYRIH